MDLSMFQNSTGAVTDAAPIVESEKQNEQEIIIEQEPNDFNKPLQGEPNEASFVPTTFEQGKEYAKLKGIASALQDSEFNNHVAQKSSEVLSDEMELERQRVELEKTKVEKSILETELEKNRVNVEQFQTTYGKNLDKQEYHYRSLLPILEFACIRKPMNVYVMWSFAVIVFLPFVAFKIIDMCVGNPIRWIFGLFRKEEQKQYKARLEIKEKQ